MKRRGLSGPAILAIITTLACALAVASIVIMLGLLPPDDLAQLGRLAQ
ncbi:hypothetical protein [Microcella sp.]